MSQSISKTAPLTLKQSVTFPANQAAQKPTLATLISDMLSTTTRDEIQIPDGEEWRITDLFISVAGDVQSGADCYLQLEKGRRYSMGSWGPLSTLLVSNQQRPKMRYAVGYKAGEILRILGINIAAIAGSNVTSSFYMEIQRYFR